MLSLGPRSCNKCSTHHFSEYFDDDEGCYIRKCDECKTLFAHSFDRYEWYDGSPVEECNATEIKCLEDLFDSETDEVDLAWSV